MHMHMFVNTQKRDWKSNKKLKVICRECSELVRYMELPHCSHYFYMLLECFTTRILGYILNKAFLMQGNMHKLPTTFF